MAARLQLTLAAVLGMVALGLGGVLLFGGGDSHGSTQLQLNPDGFAGPERSPDIPVANFTLTDQDGKKVSLSDFRGQVTVLTFMYSTCRDSCPLLAQQIRSALDDLGKNVPVLAVSVDPKNDTKLSAQQFVNRQSLTGRMHFLLGTKAQLAPVWHDYAMTEQTKQYDHLAYVLLLDKRGKQRIAFPIGELATDALTHDLRKLLAEPGPASPAGGA